MSAVESSIRLLVAGQVAAPVGPMSVVESSIRSLEAGQVAALAGPKSVVESSIRSPEAGQVFATSAKLLESVQFGLSSSVLVVVSVSGRYSSSILVGPALSGHCPCSTAELVLSGRFPNSKLELLVEPLLLVVFGHCLHSNLVGLAGPNLPNSVSFRPVSVG